MAASASPTPSMRSSGAGSPSVRSMTSSSCRGAPAIVPLTTADPYLGELLVGYCEEGLAHRTRPQKPCEPGSRTNHATSSARQARVGEVARELGIGQRTLSRRLAAENLTFSGILDELRADLARRHLRDTSLSISQIAWLLGFQEVSAFTHAFKRWTGQTPTDLRTELPEK